MTISKKCNMSTLIRSYFGVLKYTLILSKNYIYIKIYLRIIPCTRLKLVQREKKGVGGYIGGGGLGRGGGEGCL